MRKLIRINSDSGGNGDIWMRLISLYAVASLHPSLTLQVYIPSFMINLANSTFGSRIEFLPSNNSCNYHYTVLGLRGIISGILRGNKYIVPYHRTVISDKKKLILKDRLNITLFNLAKSLGIVQLPSWRWVNKYQGYLEIIGIKEFRKISYSSFLIQLQKDRREIKESLQFTKVPISPELCVPGDLRNNVLVFPTGTSRQFVPIWWAKRYLPDAYYAFFINDKDAVKFEKNGLKTISFYKEPGDIIFLSHIAKWTISTDSFPSHLLQSTTNKCTITLTEVLKSRIISPAFKGKIIDAIAPCHPCLHLDRVSHPLCMAGFKECINWRSKVYTENILNSIPFSNTAREVRNPKGNILV